MKPRVFNNGGSICRQYASSSTSASVTSACRDVHSAASSVTRTSSLASRKSERVHLDHPRPPYGHQLLRAVREQPLGQAEFANIGQLGDLRQISVSSECGPTAPGPRLSEAGSAVPSSLPSATRADGQPAHTSPRRVTVCAQKTRSARGPVPRPRSARYDPGAQCGRCGTARAGRRAAGPPPARPGRPQQRAGGQPFLIRAGRWAKAERLTDLRTAPLRRAGRKVVLRQVLRRHLTMSAMGNQPLALPEPHRRRR